MIKKAERPLPVLPFQQNVSNNSTIFYNTGVDIQDLVALMNYTTSGFMVLNNRIQGSGNRILNENINLRGDANFLSKPTVNGTAVLLSGEIDNKFVSIYGNQTISGVKNFSSRPTVNGSGVLLNGETQQVNTQNIVSTSGNQTISGAKTFITGIDIVSGFGSQRLRVFNSSGINTGEFGIFGWQTTGAAGTSNVLMVGASVSQRGRLRDTVITGADIYINPSGITNFNKRPMVNGTGVLLSGEASAAGGGGSVTNAVFTTGDQIISGAKTFSPVDSMEFSGADVYFTDNYVYFNTGSYARVSGTHIFYNGFIMVDETGAPWKINIAGGQLTVTSI